MSENNKICKNCKFFAVDIIEQQYPHNHPDAPKFPQCRRFAPRIISGSGEGWSSQLFPKVEETFWCGDFERSEMRYFGEK